MYKKLLFFSSLLITIVLLLAACQPATIPTEDVTSQTKEMLPTNTIMSFTETEQPTETENIPTATATVELTPTPEGQIFRDDFSDSLAPDWTWKDEHKESWKITDDGFLQIIGDYDLLLTSGMQNNLLCTRLPEGDFSVSTHVIASPEDNFQQSALYIYEDGNNFVTINRGYCDLGACETGGNGFFMDYKVNGNWGAYRVATSGTEVYLKLERVGTILSGYYATKADEWQRLGRFGDLFELNQVCLGVGNGADVSSNLVAQFDYFEITKP